MLMEVGDDVEVVDVVALVGITVLEAVVIDVVTGTVVVPWT